ncbi:MAG: multiple sugar transport system permease protein [Thermomicrobiales bacterium]|nr:multiple sugar transport system permease protein [Thermomicrobiales bacterium]
MSAGADAIGSRRGIQIQRSTQRKRRRALGSIFIVAMLVLIVFWTLFPFYWSLMNAFKQPQDNYGNNWLPWIQFEPTVRPWRILWDEREIRKALLNSTIVSVGAASVALVLGTLAAYGIARFRFNRPRNGSLTTWFLSQRVLPPVIFVTPFFLIIRELNLIDTVWALILLNATFNLPFPVIILTQMFREIPRELEEAAQVDGASRLAIFLRIAVPLVLPGIVVSWILCLAFSWNEFLFGFATTVTDARPIPVFLAGGDQTRGVDFQAIGTRMAVATSVPLIAALMVQRYIVRGLSLGAVKG